MNSENSHTTTEPPATEKVRAIEVQPYRWGLWCRIEGLKDPIVNQIVVKGWSDDGKTMHFMLDSHNFMTGIDPDEMLDLVPVDDPYAPKTDRETWQDFAARRPTPKPTCPVCGSEVKNG